MDLTGRLRQRSEQSKAVAQVDCGDLGVLTVQGLPLRECEALAAGPDGDRALFYAACRQLQSAGEQLRREGIAPLLEQLRQVRRGGPDGRAGGRTAVRMEYWDRRRSRSARGRERGGCGGERGPLRPRGRTCRRGDRENARRDLFS